jgi:hypothetical protein
VTREESLKQNLFSPNLSSDTTTREDSNHFKITPTVDERYRPTMIQDDKTIDVNGRGMQQQYRKN